MYFFNYFLWQFVQVAPSSTYLQSVFVRKKGCSVSIHKLLNPSPLLIKPGKFNENSFHTPPNLNGMLFFGNNQKILLACPGGLLQIKSKNTKTESTTAVCKNTIFEGNNKKFALNQVKCSKPPSDKSRLVKGEIQIGFEISKNFVPIIFVKFDQKHLKTLYTKFTLRHTAKNNQKGPYRGAFKSDFFGNIQIDKIYTKKEHQKTINGLLGLPPKSTKYVKNRGQYFLARGHLVARMFFVYGSQQIATFYYVNAAPQWQTFNNGNWKYLEMRLLDFASKKKRDMTVYVGTYGVSSLPHEKTGKKIHLYLHPKGIPVPELFWVVWYKKEDKSAIVFLGLNNPHQKNVSGSIICPDISDKISWPKWPKKDIKKGYSYACTVQSFRKKVKFLPKFQVKSLLIP